MGDWIKYGALAILSVFFLIFGIHILVASYRLKDPFSFLMAFFGSNLIILISAVGVAGFVVRLVQACRSKGKDKNATPLP